MSGIGSIGSQNLVPQSLTRSGGEQPTGGSKTFLDTMAEAVERVEDLQAKADQSVADLATGKRKTLHETMIAVEQADLGFRMLMAVRNKVVSAYQEIMRMQF